MNKFWIKFKFAIPCLMPPMVFAIIPIYVGLFLYSPGLKKIFFPVLAILVLIGWYRTYRGEWSDIHICPNCGYERYDHFPRGMDCYMNYWICNKCKYEWFASYHADPETIDPINITQETFNLDNPKKKS